MANATTQGHEKPPVQAYAQGIIKAQPGIVWEVLTDFVRWPEWNEDVSSLSVEGSVEPGTQFRWKAGGLTIASQLLEVSPPHRIVWQGRTLGISAVHAWNLEARPEGTLVRTEESFTGLLPRLLSGLMMKKLTKNLEKSIRMLSAAAERRAAGKTE